MKMGSKLGEKEIKKYSDLVDEFSDTFALFIDVVYKTLKVLRPP
jgi:hypothetical protein